MRFRLSAYILTLLLVTAPLAGALELKDKTYNTQGAGKVTFSHSSHLKKKSIRSANVGCRSCHNSKLKEHTRYTMADMYQGKSCGICHNGSKAFSVAKCTGCHKVRDISYRIKETGITTFSHREHLRKMQCNACHNGLFNAGPNRRVKMAEMEKGKSCGACHNGKNTFALSKCGKCHPVKEKKYRIPGAGDVAFNHDLHLESYSCRKCHTGLYKTGRGNKPATMAEMEAGKSCGACHDDKTAFTVKQNCDRCHKV